MNTPTVKLLIPTSDGTFLAHYSIHGLAELNFPHRHERGSETQVRNKLPTEIRKWHQTTVTALKEMLAGKKVKKIFRHLTWWERISKKASGAQCGEFLPAKPKAMGKLPRPSANLMPSAP